MIYSATFWKQIMTRFQILSISSIYLYSCCFLRERLLGIRDISGKRRIGFLLCLITGNDPEALILNKQKYIRIKSCILWIACKGLRCFFEKQNFFHFSKWVLITRFLIEHYTFFSYRYSWWILGGFHFNFIFCGGRDAKFSQGFPNQFLEEVNVLKTRYRRKLANDK